MTTYVRCINNRKYLYFAGEPRSEHDTIPFLVIGQVYKVAPPDPNDGPDELRVIDGEGEDYLYPSEYFEPFLPNGAEKTESITVHLDAYLKGVLHAEAIAAKKPMGVLVREWIDERLDLPT
ncbi:MAG: hypothetical protein U0350_36235 [Caldilineaceae bacterium]